MSYGIGVAYINVQLQFQKFFDCPISYDLAKDRISLSPNWGTTIWRMPLWYTTNIGVGVAFLYSIGRLSMIMATHEKSDNLQTILREVGFYVFVLALAIQALITWYTVEKDPSTFTFLSGDIFHLEKIRYVGWPTIHRLPSIAEMFAYYMTVGFCMFPFAFAIFPFLQSFDPLSNHLAYLIPNEIPRKVIAAVLYTGFSLLAAISCCVQILIGMVCCNSTENISYENIGLSERFVRNVDDNGERIEAPPHPLIKLLNDSIKLSFIVLDKLIQGKWPKPKTVPRKPMSRGGHEGPHSDVQQPVQNGRDEKMEPLGVVVVLGRKSASANATKSRERKKLAEKFKKLRLVHNQISILVPSSSQVCNAWNPGIAGVGIVLVVIANYGLIKLFNDLEALVLPLIFTEILVITLINFFCKHALRPGDNSEEFCHFWEEKQLMLPLVERKQVRALIKFAYTMGPFFKMSSETKVSIMETIVELTVDLLVLEA